MTQTPPLNQDLGQVLADQSTLVRNAWLEQLMQYGVPMSDDVRGSDVTTQKAHAAGSALAQIHTLGQKFPLVVENPNAPEHMLSLLEKMAELANEEQHSLIHTLQTRLAKKLDKPPFEVPEGMGHGAYAPSSIEFDGEGRLAAISDWKDACGDSWLYDLAVALNFWGFDTQGTYRASWFHSFLAGYENSRSLTANERRLFNHELRRAALVRATHALNKGLVEENPCLWEAEFNILETHLSKLELADYAS